MSVNYCKIDSLDLFNDLKSTNISLSSFKDIITCYKKLEDSYIKERKVDLLKDLNKQKRTIFSYLSSCHDQSLKKMARLTASIEQEMGNIDTIDTLQDNIKDAKFIKVSYDNGSWKISAEYLSDDIEFDKKQVPDAINCLVKLVDRMDEQEAAYALCHARKAGKFILAELPFVRTDFNDNPFETRYIKEPGMTYGPYEKPSDALYTTQLPVSRQMASEESELGEEEVSESDVLITEDGSLMPITLVTDDYVITSNDNGVFSLDEVKENLRTGKWKKQAAEGEDARVRRLKKQIDELVNTGYKEKLILDEALNRQIDNFAAKLTEKYATRLEELDRVREMVEPKVKKLAAKINEITFNDNEGKQKLQRLSIQLDSGTEVKYSQPVEQYQKRVVSVKEAEQLLDMAKKYVSPRALKKFEEEVVNKFFYYTSAVEKFDVVLRNKDPRNEELIREQMEELGKNIKNSLDNHLYKDEAYDRLDNMLIDGTINFDQYNKLSDFAEINAKQVMASLDIINSNYNKIVQAGFLSDLKDKVLSLYNSIKNWFSDTFSTLLLQEKTTKEINSALDSVLEGE